MLPFVLAVVSPHEAHAGVQARTGSTAAPFLKLPSGARAIGMGETYVAAGDDVQSLSWNPAGMALMTKRQFTFMHAQWFEGVRYESAAYAQPLGGFIFVAGGVDFLDSGSIDKTDFAEGDATGRAFGPEFATLTDFRTGGTFSVSNVVISVAGAVDVSKLRWIPVPGVQAGINIRTLLEKIDKESAAGATVDLGALWSPEKIPDLSVALVGQNMGPRVRGSTPPIAGRIGLAYRWLDRKLITALEYYQPNDNFGRISGGVEYWYRRLVAIRGGYRFQGKVDLNEFGNGVLEGVSLGAGFRYQIVQVDYAFASLGFFGATHRLSLTVSF